MQQRPMAPKTQVIKNQHFDEALEISESEEVESRTSPNKQPSGDSPPLHSEERDDSDDELDHELEIARKGTQPSSNKTNMRSSGTGPGAVSSTSIHDKRPNAESLGPMDNDELDVDYGMDSKKKHAKSKQDSSSQLDLKNQIAPEVKELLQYITRFTPHEIELETDLKAFIPDYIPAVGDIDPFIKIPRPDIKTDNLGLVVLDEPSGKQTDPSVLDLQLRALSKEATMLPIAVRRIENTNRDATSKKAIDNWITNINDLHRQKPAAVVHYSKPMPDIETLMQEWPRGLEDLLSKVELPSALLDLDLASFAKLCTSLLDVPVNGSMIESLHVVFSLYSEFKSSQHFKNLENVVPVTSQINGLQVGPVPHSLQGLPDDRGEPKSSPLIHPR